MKTSRRTSTGKSAPQRAGAKADRAARPAPRRETVELDLPREDAYREPYRPELVARLELAVRAGRYRPDAQAIATAMVDRIDALLG